MILTVYPIEGTLTVTDSRLAFADVVKVKLEGTGYDIVYETPAGRQVRYIQSGQLQFTQPFGPNNKIYVWTNN